MASLGTRKIDDTGLDATVLGFGAGRLATSSS